MAQQCTGTTTKGARCRKPVVKDGLCGVHLGMSRGTFTGGRPHTLVEHPNLIAKAEQEYALSPYDTAVAPSLGVSTATVREWRSAAARALREPVDTLTNTDNALIAFEAARDRGRARWKRARQAVLAKAASAGAWQAAAWELERAFPDEFGRKQVIQHQGDEQQPVVVQNVTYTPPEES